MKTNLHPKMHIIEVVDADGNKYKLASTKPGNITVNSSRTIHSAWTGVQSVIKNNDKADKLKKFFF